MISASKYQHIINFMSLLKVSLCINRPKQRLLCMDTRRGCRSKRSPTPWKNKNIFFTVWGAFLLLFSMGRALCFFVFLWGAFFIVWRPFCYFFFTWGAFLPRFPLGVGLFSQCGGLFSLFFSMWGDFFVFMGNFKSLWFFCKLAPSPYDLFCGRMLLCNFHPMSSAITYNGHYVPNKAHCNTRVQFTITMK